MDSTGECTSIGNSVLKTSEEAIDEVSDHLQEIIFDGHGWLRVDQGRSRPMRR